MKIIDNKGHYWNDDGTEFNPDFIPKPGLCITCANDADPNQEILCNLIRADQSDEPSFQCYSFRPIGSKPDIDEDVIKF